ncbi:hypothetical protein B0G69_3411 [Paraburkholderia sp. RAU2J]|nr:hypothetical protein B0G69_3411 [Paraburkholderia sp. RAU2J]
MAADFFAGSGAEALSFIVQPAVGRAYEGTTHGTAVQSNYDDDGATPVLRAFLASHRTRNRSIYRYTTGVV